MKYSKRKVLNLIGKALIQKKETIAVAESVTTGLLQYALGTIENASLFYQGGITTYNLGQKSKHLNVEPIRAIEVNCVSDKIASQMALEVSHLFHSTWGIGITGYSSPVPEAGGKLFCHIAIAYKGQLVKNSCVDANDKDPVEIQEQYLSEVIHCMKSLLNIDRAETGAPD